MPRAEFVHLHGHSEYSLLDGGCRIGDTAALAAELEMPALAVTDHGNLFGAVEHYRACRETGIKPIIGCEVYVAVGSRHDRKAAKGLSHASHHLVLLARNSSGYHNLVKLVSKAYLEGFYYFPRIDRELLAEHCEGLICLSGCVSGEIPHLLQNEGLAAAEQSARWFADHFGEDYYLEIQRHGIEAEAKVNEGLLELHRKLGVPLVATNDFHFLRADDHDAHDALICIQTGKTVDDDNRLCYPDGLFMKSPAQMQELFADLPGALEKTVEIADKCDLELDFGKSLMPDFPIPQGYENSGDYLTRLAREGLERRYGKPGPDLEKRLDYELDLLIKEGFAGYFLIVWDIVKFARRSGISVGPGRGSASGSLVSYCLEITDTDPIRFGLLFERFLNPERIEPPDIDIDFADTGRDKVVRYIVDKYGERNVSQVITFGTMGAKAVVRDVGRVLGMPFGEVDGIAKLIPNELKITLDSAIERVPELQQLAEAPGEEGRLIEYSRKLEGMARHASVHACAVIIAPSELTDYVPLYRAPKDGTVTTQFDGETCMSVGLLKMDILGLKELSLMDEAERLIRLHEPGFDLSAIPRDDAATFDLFSRGDTIGVFQFESAGMREYLVQLKPDKIEDVIAMNALYRPGPMQRIPDFIARKQGQQAVEYDHPLLEPILEETYGVITYQEQVQRIAGDMAGFTLGQADGIRKAMGKKLADVMEKYRHDFLEGAQGNGVPPKVAEKVWEDVEVFSGYGFNKSHSACYSEVAYKNAYLKAHYPREYMAASLTTDRNNTDRLTVLLEECRNMELPVLAPDVDESAPDFTPTPEGIRFGLSAIKNVGEGAAQAISEARTEGDRFADLFDLCQRLDLKAVNRRVIESLIAAGAVDRPGTHRAQMLEGLDLVLRNAQIFNEQKLRGQRSLFDDAGEVVAQVDKPSLPETAEWSQSERLERERELLGFYVSSHPLNEHARDLRFFATPIGELERYADGASVRIGGLITRVSTSTDRRGQSIAFATIEDQAARTDAVFFSDAYTKFRSLIEQGQAVLAEGRVSRRNGNLGLQAESLIPLAEARQKLTKAVNFVLKLDDESSSDLLQRLRRLVEQHTGNCELLIHLRNGDGNAAVVRSRSLRVNPSDELLKAVGTLIEPEKPWLTEAPDPARGVPARP